MCSYVLTKIQGLAAQLGPEAVRIGRHSICCIVWVYVFPATLDNWRPAMRVALSSCKTYSCYVFKYLLDILPAQIPMTVIL
jgi:hypothetical protein